jgi:pimeloyl-ACP methyl ester carboxylesterase
MSASPTTPDAIADAGRRRFLGQATVALTSASWVVAGRAATSAISPRIAAFGPLKHVDAGALRIGYVELGPSTGPPVLLLHGWPYDIHSYAEVAPLLADQGYRVIVPYLRGHGATRFRSEETPRNGQPAALALDTIAMMDALGIAQAVIGGYDWGGRSADVIAALWPQRCKALVSVSGYLLTSRQGNKAPQSPQAEFAFWYQYYFATERGRAGYAQNLHEFNKLIWRLASPKWAFDDATFDRSAAAFDNPDHVAITIHNYRWRLGLAEGEPRYDAVEEQIARSPLITVPTITLEGDANGAPHADPSAYAARFSGRHEHRLVTGGIGHNLPQEAPRAFAQAIVDVDRF